MPPKRTFLEELRATHRIKIEHDTYWRAYRMAFGQPDPNLERQHMRDELDALASTGHITLPRTSNSWRAHPRPPLPSFITLTRHHPTPQPTSEWRDHPWHPHLHWIPTATRLTQTAHTILHAIDDTLKRGGFPTPAPIKLRSLQLTHNEKALSLFLKQEIARKHPDLERLLNISTGPLPLTRERLRNTPTHHSVTYLIIENEEPYRLLYEALKAAPKQPYDWIAQGSGNVLPASIEWLTLEPHAQQIRAIHYLGDLDAAGLRTATITNTRTQELGLPPLTPATALHHAMLTYARELGAPDGYPNPKNAARQDGINNPHLANFLNPTHQPHAKRILELGHRIPEEIIAHDLPRIIQHLTSES